MLKDLEFIRIVRDGFCIASFFWFGFYLYKPSEYIIFLFMGNALISIVMGLYVVYQDYSEWKYNRDISI